MTKLTPAKRLKQLKASGWLDFVEHMEAHDLTPRQVARSEAEAMIALGCFSTANCSLWLAQDMERDLFDREARFNEPNDMLGLSAQLANPREGAFPKTKKNKIIQRFKKDGEPL